MQFNRAIFRQSRRPVVVIVSLVLLYTLIGFFLLPWLAERQLTNTMQQRLGVQASVEQIQFNPYTFEVTINNLRLTTEQDAPLAAWETLYLNLQPTQLVQMNLRIEEISLASPDLHFRRYSNTDNTLTRLADKWAASAEDEAADDEKTQKSSEQEEPLFTLEIGAFNYADGEIHYRDDVPSETFETVLSPINIHLEDFSTAAGQTASKDLMIALENDARLTLDGNLSLSPLALAGQAQLENFSLQTPYRYLQAQLPFELKDGRLDLQFAYDIDLAGEAADIDINDIGLELAGFGVHEPGESDALLQAGKLTIVNARYAYPENQLSMENVTLDDFKLAAIQNEAGELNWLQLMANLPESDADEAPADNEQPAMQLSINNIAINNTSLAVEDQMPETPVNLALMLSASLQDFSLADDQQMPFTSNIRLDSGGDIEVQGDLQIFPDVAVAAEASVEQLSLLPVQAYLSQYAHIELVDGKIDSTATFSSDEEDLFAIQGNLGLTDLQLDNQKLDEKLISLDKLAVNNMDFSLAGQQLAISEVIVDALYSRVLINEDGETNMALLMKEQPATDHAESDKADSDSSNGYDFSLGRVEINNASSRFTDQNLPIVFNAHMQKLNGEISGFSTRSQQPVDIALEGQVDEFGLVEISGAMNPLNITNQTTINMAFSNLDLPAMSPYTVKFAGRQIDEGRGDIELTYEIVESELKASNDIVIRDIRLGDRVESPDALDLPLDLAVALLKNSDGVIELNIPVTGDVSDPQFAMGPVIRGAIRNALGNIVSAPFRFLGSLLGGDDEAIDEIRFRAGRSDLAPPEQQKLNKLVEAMSQRPELALQIPAPFDEAADRQSLKKSTVEQRIESRLSEVVSAEQLDVKRQKVLETLYTEAGLTPDLQSLQQAFSENADTEAQSEAELDVLAYNARLKASLVEAESVTDPQLQNLAKQRQAAVVEYLKQQGLDAEQLQTRDTVSSKLDDGWLSMKFDLGTI